MTAHDFAGERAAADLAGASIAAILRTPPLDPLETRILLGHALNLSRVQLITQSERTLTGDEAHRLCALLARRLHGEPIAYITGRREFHGLSLQVTPDVLIPRPDTELLVDLALEKLPRNGSVLDMGTGSGAIAVAIGHARPDASVTALDASAAALDIAQRNAAQHATPVNLLLSDWYDALDANRRFAALTDHADGLSALRIILAGAARHLNTGGWLLLEHGYDQAAAVRDLLAAHGFDGVTSWRDLAGIERATGGVICT
jgi:release factor glutamine methyltransferase